MFLQFGRHIQRGAISIHHLNSGQTKTHRFVHACNLLEELTHRGFIHNITRPEILSDVLENKRQAVYVGIDPTAASLHIGHLIPLMCLLHFGLRGHKVIPLIGGATGRVGDPSGRLTERQPTDIKQVASNVESLTKCVKLFFHRAFHYARTRGLSNEPGIESVVASNLQWHGNVNLLDFLQTVGIHTRVSTMLNRESVHARLTSQRGLSFTEFTYQLLQAYDFYHLHKNFGCTIQIGGSDQWGNILAGIELIGRLDPSASDVAIGVFGLTTPLLTTTSGEKIGKSAGNAVWLDSNLTSVFDFYQYFIRVEDADVEKYLNTFTLLQYSEIDAVMMVHREQPENRIAQRRLASEVTEMVHMSSGLERARTLTTLLFESRYDGLTANQIISAFEGDPRLIVIDQGELLDSSVTKLAARYGLVPSASAARNLVQGRGLYINNITVPEVHHKIPISELIGNQVAILRAGKDKLLILAGSKKASTITP